MASDYGTLGGVSALGAVDAWALESHLPCGQMPHITGRYGPLRSVTCRRASTPAPTPTQPPRLQHSRVGVLVTSFSLHVTNQHVVSNLERYDW